MTAVSATFPLGLATRDGYQFAVSGPDIRQRPSAQVHFVTTRMLDARGGDVRRTVALADPLHAGSQQLPGAGARPRPASRSPRTSLTVATIRAWTPDVTPSWVSDSPRTPRSTSRFVASVLDDILDGVLGLLLGLASIALRLLAPSFDGQALVPHETAGCLLDLALGLLAFA